MVNRLVPIYYLSSPSIIYTLRLDNENRILLRRIFQTEHSSYSIERVESSSRRVISFSPRHFRGLALYNADVYLVKCIPDNVNVPFLFFLRNEKVRNKSVKRKEDGRRVGARFTGRGSYVSRLYLQTRPINRFIAGPVQGISITREKEREDFSRDSIARFISIAGENKGRG